MSCRCNDEGRVLADRGHAAVEVACGRCTPIEVKLLWEWVHELRREVDELRAQLPPASHQEPAPGGPPAKQDT